MEMVENDKITSDYDISFILHVVSLIEKDVALSAKQEAHLERCFHDRY
jgi:hypothetical protein